MIVAVGTLILTIVCEMGVAIALGALRILSTPTKRLLVDVPLVNLLTQPLATLLFRNDIASFTVVELLVFASECVLYRAVTRLSWAQSVGLSLVANGVTVAIALAISGA